MFLAKKTGNFVAQIQQKQDLAGFESAKGDSFKNQQAVQGFDAINVNVDAVGDFFVLLLQQRRTDTPLTRLNPPPD